MLLHFQCFTYNLAITYQPRHQSCGINFLRTFVQSNHLSASSHCWRHISSICRRIDFLNAEELTTRTLVSIKNFVFFITCITRRIFTMLFLVDRVAQSFMSSACGFPLLMLSCAASPHSVRLCSRFVHTLMSFLTERLGLLYHVLFGFLNFPAYCKLGCRF